MTTTTMVMQRMLANIVNWKNRQWSRVDRHRQDSPREGQCHGVERCLEFPGHCTIGKRDPRIQSEWSLLLDRGCPLVWGMVDPLQVVVVVGGGRPPQK